MKRSILLGILGILVVLQFIRPAQNLGEYPSANDISKVYTLPDSVNEFLTTKCYDCHSNRTEYPWYAHVQPVGWWLASHVEDGKRHLNLAEFKSYSKEKAAHKLRELSEAVNEGWMPLESYTFIHGDKVVTAADRKVFNQWLASLPEGTVEKEK